MYDIPIYIFSFYNNFMIYISAKNEYICLKKRNIKLMNNYLTWCPGIILNASKVEDESNFD